ncbi:hypothetical protein ACQKKK_09370 [Peribacillus sp. NPDC006672]|uniref:hypothetical protein n=1 Tax=Peribacillus sp. NPDC006672 TaxID=3390606 RepID=UPI003D006CF6
MWFKIFSFIFILCGLFVMWFAVFGDKKVVKEFGSGTPTNIIDFIVMMVYRIFPSIIRRIFLFALGMAISIGCTYMLLYL